MGKKNLTWRNRYKGHEDGNCYNCLTYNSIGDHYDCPRQCFSCGKEICPVCGRKLTVPCVDEFHEETGAFNCECGWQHCDPGGCI